MNGEGCLEPETLVALVEDRADDLLRARVLDHVATCDPCRQIVSELAIDGAPRAAIAAGERIGRYQILRLEGEGGMGAVYVARDTELERDVAIKVLPFDTRGDRLAERLRREAQALARLRHPNVVAVHDVGVHGETVYIAMEYLAGGTLAAWLEEPHEWRAIVQRFIRAGRGLAAAHAAGLVHRDFKPENVLLDADQLRVGDFGLARSIDAAETAPGDQPASTIDLTHTGAIVGTPLYMAPEQHRGEPADAASDQFAFCLALWFGLYRQRAFAGANALALATAVMKGELQPPPGESRVPARIERVLRRGLATDRDRRWPSMAALLEALERATRRRWPIVVAAGVVLAMVASVAYAATQLHAQPCAGAGDGFVWQPPRRTSVVAAFHRLGQPFADAASDDVTRELDRYATRWSGARIEACRAARVVEVETAAQLEARTTCLDRRASEAGALVARFEHVDLVGASHASDAVRALPDPESCTEPGALATTLTPPALPIRALVDAGWRDLAEVRALDATGAYRDALDRIHAVRARTAMLGYHPLDAAVLLQQAQLATRLDDFTTAETTLDDALWAAEAARDDRTVIGALAGQIDLARQRSRFEIIAGLIRRATAVLERMVVDRDGATLELDDVRGAVELDQQKLDQATATFERVVAAIEQHRGASSIDLVAPLLQLARIAKHRDDLEHARALVHRALTIQHGVYGDDHPAVATTLLVLSAVEADDTAAETDLDRALAIRTRVFGDASEAATQVRYNLGLLYGERGDNARSIEVLRAVVAADRRVLGADDVRTAGHLAGLAEALATTNAYDEAATTAREALALLRRQRGDHTEVAETLVTLAEIENGRHHPADALEAAREADAIYRRVLGRAISDPLREIGAAYLQLGTPDAAIAPLTDAVAGYHDDPARALWASSLLARAIYDAGDRPKGRALAISTDEKMKADERLAAYREELEGWMTARRIRYSEQP